MMQEPIHLRTITRSDFTEWQQMRKALYHNMEDEFDDQEMDRIVDNPQWQCMFVKFSDTNIGFVELSLRNIVDGCLGSPVPYIEGIYLKPDYQGLGYGHKVIELLKKRSIERGYHELAADTELDNPNAQKFFTSMGFKETYRTIGFRIDLSK